jgi:hypothetical protein
VLERVPDAVPLAKMELVLCVGFATWSPTTAIAAMARTKSATAAIAVVFMSYTKARSAEKGPPETGVPSQSGTPFRAWNFRTWKIHMIGLICRIFLRLEFRPHRRVLEECPSQPRGVGRLIRSKIAKPLKAPWRARSSDPTMGEKPG